MQITASVLVELLQTLGALVADYTVNPKQPAAKLLSPLLKPQPKFQSKLPSLPNAINIAKSGGDKMTALYTLGIELKSTFEDFRAVESFTNEELQLLKAIRAYLVTDSEPALNFIRKNASLFDSPVLAQAFVPSAPHADNKALRRTVRTLVGRDGTGLTIEEASALKETDPEGYANYAQLRKEHNTQFKTLLMAFVRQSGRRIIPYAEAYTHMYDLGFTHSMVPGFTGMVDDQGRWYTNEGEIINGVPNLATYAKVVMNSGGDDEGEDWVFKAVKAGGGIAYGYTANYKRQQSKSKFANVKVLTSKIKGIRNKWLNDVKNFDPNDKDSVAAVVLEILYSFAARVGSAPGRGVGTLLVKNARIVTNGINLLYLGKDSIKTRHVITEADPIQKLVLKCLNQLIDGKADKDYIFTVGPKRNRVTPADVNAAFHRFGAPSGVTIHKLRTVRGTSLFSQLVEKDATKRAPTTEKEALARYNDMTKKVGMLLNHKRGVGSGKESFTGTTAALSYISGDVQVGLFRAWGFRVPKHLEALIKKGD
jgi:hypothetical protein